MKPFATLGEQLKAVYDLRKGLVADERLEKVNNAAGVTGTNGPDGGFALQEDFAGAILESAVRQSPLLNRLDRYTCSSAANAMRWLHADETDISTSVFGGIQMFWAAEGAGISRPRAWAEIPQRPIASAAMSMASARSFPSVLISRSGT